MQILSGNVDLFQRFFQQRKGQWGREHSTETVSGVGPSPSIEV